MSRHDHNALALQINCAACHGLLSWADRNGLLQQHQLITPTSAFSSDLHGRQQQTLLAVTRWALECLGVSNTSREFWKGWAGERHQGNHARSWQLGRLCRTAPTLLKQTTGDRAPARQAAMYHCYETLLLNPDQRRSDGVDGHVDDRGGDLELSEAVYQQNFKSPLHVLINQIVAEHRESSTLTFIDVGAGSGGMLMDIAETVLKKTHNAIFVAFDPSEVSRESCRRKAKEKPSIAMHVADGSIENPAHILQTLRANDIPSEHCVVLAKAALHDRTLSRSISRQGSTGSNQQTANTSKVSVNNYVYRDKGWAQVDKHVLVEDMVAVLDLWKQVVPTAKLIILESHLLPTRTINEHIERIALLPAYISHSLSAQYMLPANDHHQATLQTKFKENLFVPIHVTPDGNALMSLTLLQG